MTHDTVSHEALDVLAAPQNAAEIALAQTHTLYEDARPWEPVYSQSQSLPSPPKTFLRRHAYKLTALLCLVMAAVASLGVYTLIAGEFLSALGWATVCLSVLMLSHKVLFTALLEKDARVEDRKRMLRNNRQLMQCAPGSSLRETHITRTHRGEHPPGDYNTYAVHHLRAHTRADDKLQLVKYRKVGNNVQACLIHAETVETDVEAYVSQAAELAELAAKAENASYERAVEAKLEADKAKLEADALKMSQREAQRLADLEYETRAETIRAITSS